ncbi:hypothetical protein Tco_1040182 [Tanacetum coccineum]
MLLSSMPLVYSLPPSMVCGDGDWCVTLESLQFGTDAIQVTVVRNTARKTLSHAMSLQQKCWSDSDGDGLMVLNALVDQSNYLLGEGGVTTVVSSARL